MPSSECLTFEGKGTSRGCSQREWRGCPQGGEAHPLAVKDSPSSPVLDLFLPPLLPGKGASESSRRAAREILKVKGNGWALHSYY